ncbi:hypothetical protein [Paraburkholderia sp. SIMBA_030]|uniref:hypothetical protein n=1 Tax=Paraburkholderia sp. SIMBA_030 TaxID=3085773 RepID=UPI00397A00F0
MSKIVCRIALLIFPLMIHSAANADEMQGSCMASFKIKEGASVMIAARSVKCDTVEARRLELFNSVEKLKTDGQIDLTPTANQIAAINQKLDQMKSKNDWSGLGMDITGNALATIGLATCAETGGGGCALAVVGKVLSVVSLVKGKVLEADGNQTISDVQQKLAKLSTDLQGKSSPAAALRNRMVQEFNGLCVEVKKSCLEK